MDEPRNKNGLVGWVAGVFSACLLLVGWIVLAGWIGGDTREWSQWLSWIPAPLLLLVALLGLLLTAFVHGRGGTILGSLQFVLVLFLASWTVGADWGMYRAASTNAKDLVVLHWNASWPGETTNLEDAYRAIRSADPDLVVITEPGQFGWGEKGQAFLNSWPHVARSSGILLLSRQRMSEVRPILAADGIDLVYVRIPVAGVDRSIWVLDLPSDPAQPRGPIFQKVLAAARSKHLSEPDLVVGDFNVPRHSRALTTAFPKMRNAFDEAGSGWSGTWPRRWPLWHLDQILVAPNLDCRRYEVINPHVGRHRMQRAVIRAARVPAT